MPRSHYRFIPAGRRRVRVLRSALGNGPDTGDLLEAYEAIMYRIGPGHEGGSLFVGLSGRGQVILGIDVDHSDPTGDGEVIFHGEWRR